MTRNASAFALLAALSAAAVFACSSSSIDTATDAGVVDDATAADTSPPKKDAGIVVPDACNSVLPTIPSKVDTQVQCDPVAQDCKDPCFSKCGYYSLQSGMALAANNFVACGPTGGDAGLDQPCVRPTNEPGFDTCAKGLTCVSFSRPANATTARTCRTNCTAASKCGPGDYCAAMTVPSNPITQGGVCAHVCDPWKTVCVTGDGCVGYVDIDNHVQLTCGNTGSTAIGQSCSGGNACVPGSACTQVGDSGTSVCAPFCDAMHPCSSGACTTPSAGATFQVCL